jgi:signal transduction histidine kinase
MNNRLAAELFQIVREGLSNIKRHSDSSWARINMTSCDGEIVLDIENEASVAEHHNGFIPRSITERAIALGGRVSVNLDSGGRTIVSVKIPM